MLYSSSSLFTNPFPIAIPLTQKCLWLYLNAVCQQHSHLQVDRELLLAVNDSRGQHWNVDSTVGLAHDVSVVKLESREYLTLGTDYRLVLSGHSQYHLPWRTAWRPRSFPRKFGRRWWWCFHQWRTSNPHRRAIRCRPRRRTEICKDYSPDRQGLTCRIVYLIPGIVVRPEVSSVFSHYVGTHLLQKTAQRRASWSAIEPKDERIILRIVLWLNKPWNHLIW